MPKFILDGVSKDDYDAAGSKFITMTPEEKAAGRAYRDVEVGELAWDTPGRSMMIPVVIKEKGVDEGKKEKVSFGISTEAIFKGKEMYRNICGKDMPFEKGSDSKQHPAPDSDALLGKKAVGYWEMATGKKGGTGADVQYPKLVSILSAGSKPTAKASL
jgi:hypothetical protein